jgi:hypothetical protein
MDPQFLYQQQWEQISRLLPHGAVFVALMVNMAISFLLAHAIIPSLEATYDIPANIRSLRRILYPISAISMLGAAVTLARAIIIMVEVLQYMYPRYTL